MSHLASLNIPKLDRLVGATSNKALRVLSPANSKNTPRVLALPNLPLRLSSLPVIEPDSSILAHTHEVVPIRTECGRIHEFLVLVAQASVIFEGRAVQEDEGCVVGSGGGAERALLPDGHAVDLGGMPGDLADGISAVRGDAVTETLLTVSYRNDTLRVAVPGDVVDAACNDVVFALCRAFAFTVPDSDGARDIAASDVESRGGETRYGSLCGMLRVLRAVFGVVYRA